MKRLLTLATLCFTTLFSPRTFAESPSHSSLVSTTADAPVPNTNWRHTPVIAVSLTPGNTAFGLLKMHKLPTTVEVYRHIADDPDNAPYFPHGWDDKTIRKTLANGNVTDVVMILSLNVKAPLVIWREEWMTNESTPCTSAIAITIPNPDMIAPSASSAALPHLFHFPRKTLLSYLRSTNPTAPSAPAMTSSCDSRTSSGAIVKNQQVQQSNPGVTNPNHPDACQSVQKKEPAKPEGCVEKKSPNPNYSPLSTGLPNPKEPLTQTKPISTIPTFDGPLFKECTETHLVGGDAAGDAFKPQRSKKSSTSQPPVIPTKTINDDTTITQTHLQKSASLFDSFFSGDFTPSGTVTDLPTQFKPFPWNPSKGKDGREHEKIPEIRTTQAAARNSKIVSAGFTVDESAMIQLSFNSETLRLPEDVLSFQSIFGGPIYGFNFISDASHVSEQFASNASNAAVGKARYASLYDTGDREDGSQGGMNVISMMGILLGASLAFTALVGYMYVSTDKGRQNVEALCDKILSVITPGRAIISS